MTFEDGLCDSCGCPIKGHPPKDTFRRNGVGGACTWKPSCPCGRLREYWTEGYDKMLQLLIIDLGDSCVVKVEKGTMPHTSVDLMKDLGFYGSLGIVRTTFAELRTALDAQESKPVPRCEMDADCRHTLHYYDGMQKCSINLGVLPWAALVELAGHPLPIYEGKKGEWEKLHNVYPTDGTPLEAWRFTLTKGESSADIMRTKFAETWKQDLQV